MKRTNAAGESTAYTYDASGNQTSSTIRKLKEVHTATHPSARLGKHGGATAIADDEDEATPVTPNGPMSPGQATRWLRRYRASTGSASS